MEYYQGKETFYEMNLSRFYAKNKNATEKDYINYKIEEYEKNLRKYLSLTDEEINNTVRERYKADINDPSYEPFVIQEIKKELYSNSKRISKHRKEVKYYKNKLKLMQLLEKEEIIDLSIEKNTEKIILLHQLGIIDFLKNREPFNTSVNKLATIISAITGIKTTTTQSYLNPMLNKDTDQKSNPLNTNKSVETIRQKLLSIGCNLDDIK